MIDRRTNLLPCIAAAALCALNGCSAGNPTAPAAPPELQYPAIPRGEQLDLYHGTSVSDPYRWLEALDSPQTHRFVQAQNDLARPYLTALPWRERIKQRLTELWNYERYELPVQAGGRYFYRRNDGLQNQSPLYVAEGLGGPSRVLLDPNALSGDGTVALSDWFPSPDGKLIAYGLSDGGTDWTSWRVREVHSGRDLADDIRHTKFTDISWLPAGDGFYYSRYPLGADGRPDDSQQAAIYFHRIGTPQSADRLVYAITDHPTRVPYGIVSEDGRYLIVDIFDGYQVNGIYYFDLARRQTEPVRLFDEWNAHYEFLGSRGTELYFATTFAAPNSRVVAVDVARAGRALREVVPEAPEALIEASYVGGRIFAQYLADARSRVRVFDLAGRELEALELPGAGTARGFDGRADDSETFFSYTDFLTPLAIYRYDIAAQRSEIFHRPVVPVDPAPYITEQVFYPSRDGTRVPMFITRRRDAVLDGSNPVLLYGYGGFKNSLLPRYKAEIITWLELGGMYASANLRGGNEYGMAWHQAGTRLNKQNVFDDFIAAAEWLIEREYTSPARLAITGRSNGGLLVGAVIAQRPELFAAALPAVGVLDMLRYHTASANARQWSSDYGLAEVPEEFAALYAYSPYHNLRAGACYPPTLITTADHDDRVVPWHSYKFAAALQHAQGCPQPVLLSVETRAGHGAGKPTWMLIEEVVDAYAFLARHLGMSALSIAGEGAVHRDKL